MGEQCRGAAASSLGARGALSDRHLPCLSRNHVSGRTPDQGTRRGSEAPPDSAAGAAPAPAAPPGSSARRRRGVSTRDSKLRPTFCAGKLSVPSIWGYCHHHCDCDHIWKCLFISPDKVRAASLAKVVSAPLVKYFKAKTHSDMAAKSKDITGNVKPKVNTLSGDYVTEREEETHKEPSQIEKADALRTPVCVNLSTEEVDLGNKLGKVNDSVSRDILAQAEVQAVTQALACDLST
ncbi:hypothetical protein NDU88_008072 [Pleurodeles waltl]|uniref:Uncharacterized protein n=1 Tax=Pleurodeles waltl TaxID=8319 RepID=A0AAV7NUW2_PLEWA|nr:hypothetical protein NDU88_008072 [Pleurodeles waltl]